MQVDEEVNEDDEVVGIPNGERCAQVASPARDKDIEKHAGQPGGEFRAGGKIVKFSG